MNPVIELLLSIVAGALGGAGAGVLVVRHQRQLLRRGQLIIHVHQPQISLSKLLTSDPWGTEAVGTLDEAEESIFSAHLRLQNTKEIDVQLRDLRVVFDDSRQGNVERPLRGPYTGQIVGGAHQREDLTLLLVRGEQSRDVAVVAYPPTQLLKTIAPTARVKIVADHGTRGQTSADVGTLQALLPGND